MMARYRTKPCEIEAIQFKDDSETLCKISEFMDNQDLRVDYSDPKNPVIKIETLEGVMRASVGDYIIRGLRNEYYPCKPDVFHKKYELVE